MLTKQDFQQLKEIIREEVPPIVKKGVKEELKIQLKPIQEELKKTR